MCSHRREKTGKPSDHRLERVSVPRGQGPCPQAHSPPPLRRAHGDSLREDYGLIRSSSLFPRLQRWWPGRAWEERREPACPAPALRLCTRLLRKPSAPPVPVTRPCVGFGPFPHVTQGEAGPVPVKGGPCSLTHPSNARLPVSLSTLSVGPRRPVEDFMGMPAGRRGRRAQLVPRERTWQPFVTE